MNRRNTAIATALSLCIAAPALAGTVRLAAPTERLKTPVQRVPRMPDLVIRRASIRRARECRPGAPALYVTAVVQNIGHSPSVAKMSVGMVQARDSDGVNWGNGHGLPALKPRQTTTVTFPVYYLQSDPGHMIGSHAFKLTVNAGKWIHESNYGNNSFGPVKVTLPVGSCGLRPDITSHKGVKIGGKFVPWGGSVTVGRKDAKRINSSGSNVCVFDFYYPMVNEGKAATSPAFVNRLREDRTLVAVNPNLHLKVGETQTIRTEPSLLLGEHVLSVSLDDHNAVSESNERNNMFRLKVRVDNSCRKGGALHRGMLPRVMSQKPHLR